MQDTHQSSQCGFWLVRRKVMKTQQQARALMMRHHQSIKNRQLSLLNRAATEIGMEPEDERPGTMQSKLPHPANLDYAPSPATMS